VQLDMIQSNKDGVRDDLSNFIHTLEAVTPDNRPDLFLTENDRVAYWINAHNAFAMYGVIGHNFVNDQALGFNLISIGGQILTLAKIEENKLAVPAHPKLYFVLNQSARSSPPLRQTPYDGAVLDAQLQDQTNIYLRDPRAVSRNMDTVAVSDLIMKHADEFIAAANRDGKHFSGILEVLQSMAPDDSPIKGAKSITTMPFDWSLNRPPR